MTKDEFDKKLLDTIADCLKGTGIKPEFIFSKIRPIIEDFIWECIKK